MAKIRGKLNPDLLPAVFMALLAGGLLGAGALVWLGATESARRNFVTDVVKRVSPAVVNIGTEQIIRKGPSLFYTGTSDPSIDEFFRDFFDPRSNRREVRHSLGSGVIIDPEGHVLTNEHVILRASKITVSLVDGRELEADMIGSDSENDLAVLKIKNKDKLPFLPMGNSDDLMDGEPAIAIGNPFGLGHTVTTGVISATHRSIQTPDRAYNDFIQTDASINPGNSGGPLINADGSLVGINTAIYQKAQGIGFAIPINRARRVVEDLIKFGEVHIGWVGIEVQDLTTMLAKKIGYEGNGGVAVITITDKSPAKKSEIQIGDIIEAVNGQDVRTREDFRLRMRQVGVGEEIAFQVFRGGKRFPVKIKTTDFPLDMSDEIARYALGIQVGPAPAGIKAVALTQVAPGSPAERSGLKPGDLILRVNNGNVTNVEEFKRAIAKARVMDSVLLLVRRGPSIYYVSLPMRP